MLTRLLDAMSSCSGLACLACLRGSDAFPSVRWGQELLMHRLPWSPCSNADQPLVSAHFHFPPHKIAHTSSSHFAARRNGEAQDIYFAGAAAGAGAAAAPMIFNEIRDEKYRQPRMGRGKMGGIIAAGAGAGALTGAVMDSLNAPNGVLLS